MVLKIFILGIGSACAAAIFEFFALRFFTGKSFLIVLLESFFIIAFAEEFAKYAIVKMFALNSAELYKPLNVMGYMAVSALGFAALESAVIFFISNGLYPITIFLHMLTSGTLGYFMAQSFYSARNKNLILFSGFSIAVFSHGIYNLSILEISGFGQFLVPAITISSLALFAACGFLKLKKLKSVCKI